MLRQKRNLSVSIRFHLRSNGDRYRFGLMGAIKWILPLIPIAIRVFHWLARHLK